MYEACVGNGLMTEADFVAKFEKVQESGRRREQQQAQQRTDDATRQHLQSIEKRLDEADSSATIREIDLQCSICLDVLDQPVTPQCGHNFCQTCLRDWRRQPRSKSNSCPLCDKKLRGALNVNIALRQMV